MSSPSSPSSSKLEVIQALRGVAAMLVVLLHFSIYIKTASPGLYSAMNFGYIGVDVFFIISGFIIYVSTAAPGARDGTSFLLRRFCRVVLPAWAAMVLTVLVAPPYLRDLISGVLFIPLKNSGPPFYGHSFLIVAWTLTYELVFYAVFAAVLASAIGRRHRALAASAVLLVLVAAFQAPQCCTLDAEQAPLFGALGGFPVQLFSLLGNPMLLEFIIGMGLAWAYLEGWFERAKPGWLLLSAPLVVAAIVVWQFTDGHGVTRAGLLAAALMFYALCWQAMGPALAGPVGRACVYLGEISYSLYLVHPSVKMGLRKLSALSGMELGAWPAFAVAMLLTLVFAHLFYRWVEVPAQRLGRWLAARRSQPKLAAVASAP